MGYRASCAGYCGMFTGVGAILILFILLVLVSCTIVLYAVNGTVSKSF